MAWSEGTCEEECFLYTLAQPNNLSFGWSGFLSVGLGTATY